MTKLERQAYNKAHYAANRERARILGRAWYLANRERKKAAGQAYRRDNQDKLRAATRAWRAANPDKVRTYMAKWQKANMETVHDHVSRRRARQRSGTVGRVSYLKLWTEFSGSCPLCAKKLRIGVQKYHYDHIVPLAKGGSHTQGNIQITHARCNRTKGAKLTIEEQTIDGTLATAPSLETSPTSHNEGPVLPGPEPREVEPQGAPAPRPRGFIPAQTLVDPGAGD